MMKQYVLRYKDRYVYFNYREKSFHLVETIEEATFFDSERLVYEDMVSLSDAFDPPTTRNMIYHIESVVVVFGGTPSK